MLHLNKENYKNKFCLDTYVIRDKNCIGYSCSKPKNLEEKLKIAAFNNFKYVELWHKDVFNYIHEYGSNSLLDFLNKFNLKVASYKVLENWFEGNSSLEVIEYAAKIKSSNLVVKLLSDTNEAPITEISWYVARYLELIKICEKYKLYPCLEFMCLAKTMNNIDFVYEILNKTNHPYNSLVLDTWHLWRNDNKNFDVFEKTLPNINKDWVKIIHFTDARKDISREFQKDGDRKMPNEGCLNLTKFCKLLTSKGINTTYSLNVYDQSLWNENPYEVAKKSMQCFNQYFNFTCNNLIDSECWINKQEERCNGLWENSYKTHLDPRFSISNRDCQLENILKEYLQDKKVLDFKCGFSPLAKFVTYGFDAYKNCIDYLNINFKNAKWWCMSDNKFVDFFNQKIDVLLHIGLGDSNSEIENHLKIRKKCNPSVVIIECAGNEDGTVNESKEGNALRWKVLCEGLKNIKLHKIHTDMKERNIRLLAIGETK
jgi:sugar phosphate isomerase/epimerase